MVNSCVFVSFLQYVLVLVVETAVLMVVLGYLHGGVRGSQENTALPAPLGLVLLDEDVSIVT